MIQEFQRNGIRTSIFVDPSLDMIEELKKWIESNYHGDFCASIRSGQSKAIEPYIAAAVLANELELGINAGHDLSLDNIQFF
jgi:pyridoxine 5-phosphate synthase